MTIPGHATLEGTDLYRQRFVDSTGETFYRKPADRWFSSLGLGTYLGEPSEADDRAYRNAVVKVVKNGVNHVDSAINYRFQRSERNVGEALGRLTAEHGFDREEIILGSKGGYVPFEEEPPSDPRTHVEETYLEPGVIEPGEIVGNNHCISPSFLEHQLRRSRSNLNVQTIDIYYVHNPETQLQTIDRDRLYERLERAFEYLEEAVEDGQIRTYGVATWNAFRQRRGTGEFLDLEEILCRAEAAGGSNHHFGAIQLPYNLGMPEAFTLKNQSLDGDPSSLLQTAQHHDLAVMSSASLLQGRLADGLPDELVEHMSEIQTDALRALQFTRSVPGLTSALVGMKTPRHIEENLKLRELDPFPLEQYMHFFQKA